MKKTEIKKFSIRALEEKGFVKFYITHPDFKGRIKKHIGKGSLSDYGNYQNDFSKDIEHFFNGKAITFEAVQNYADSYVEKKKHIGSIFNYTDEFLAIKRETFNRKTKNYLSGSAITCYKRSIDYFKKFLLSNQLGESPEVINDKVLNNYFYSLSSHSYNYCVRTHSNTKGFIKFLHEEKKLAIDISYLKSKFSEQYDNQETDEDDRALTICDMNKLNSLRDEFNAGKYRLKEYKKAKTIPEKLQLMQRQTKVANLKRTLDCFLFMCSTGMYVSDVNKIHFSIKNSRTHKYITYRRAKNNSYCKGIPLIDYGCFVGNTLVNEYKIKSGSNFPLNLSLNQFDKNLKIISELAGLDFMLTSKMARKTFASIYHFDYKIDINSIQMMLGHKDQRHTLHYLRITDDDIAGRIQDQLGHTE